MNEGFGQVTEIATLAQSVLALLQEALQVDRSSVLGAVTAQRVPDELLFSVRQFHDSVASEFHIDSFRGRRCYLHGAGYFNVNTIHLAFGCARRPQGAAARSWPNHKDTTMKHIVQLSLAYNRNIRVGIEASGTLEALSMARVLFQDGATPELPPGTPLLADEYNLDDGHSAVYEVLHHGMVEWPPADVSVRHLSQPVNGNPVDIGATLEQAIRRVEIANAEGNPILSAWLPDARAAVRCLELRQLQQADAAEVAAMFLDAYRAGQRNGGSIEWSDLDAAFTYAVNAGLVEPA